MTIIQTERLRLRALTVDDAPFYLRLLSDRSFIDNIGDKGVHTLEAARVALADGPCKMQAERGYSLYLVERGGAGNLIAAGLVLLVGGSSVEYWWPAAILGLAVWSYCKRPTWSAAVIALLALASLWFINRNLWALAAVPLLLVASRLDLPMPRLRWAFYAYYPLHLAALWLIRIPMSKAGYLFF